MSVPFSGGREYYLFENRQPIDFDLGLRGGTMHGMVWPGAPPPFGWSHVKVTDIAEQEGVVTATMEYEP